MKDYLGLLLQLRYPNDAGGAQWFGFASSEIAHVKNPGFYSVFDYWSLLYSIETGAAPVMCPCNHFIVRYLRFYRTLSNQVLFFDVWYLISIWIELLFVSDRLDKFPFIRLYFLSILMAYKLLVQSHDIPIEYWCVIRKVKSRAIIKPSTLGALQFFNLSKNYELTFGSILIGPQFDIHQIGRISVGIFVDRFAFG